MTEASPVQTILDRWYAAIRSGDAAALAGATTEDVVVRWNGPVGVVPWAGVWEGRAKVITFFRRVAEHLEVVAMQTVSRIESPDGVALVLEGQWRVKATGEELHLRAANIFRFAEGRVAVFEVYPDSHAFAQALG
ncbi:MAG: nuclear transport factor 2 family protein [Phreatobacter sp.]